MAKRYSLTLMILLVIGPLTARGDVVSSDFNSLPIFEGWSLALKWCDPTAWVENGLYYQVLGFDACPPPPDGGQDAHTRTLDAFVGSTYWFYELRLFTTGARSEIPGGAPTGLVAFNAFADDYTVYVASDQLMLFRDALLPILFFDLAPGVFHTIRVELDNNDPPTYEWFIDSVSVDAGLAEHTFPSHDARMTWRGKAWFLPTENAWDYIRYGDIPVDASGDFDSNGAADSFELFYFAECLDRSESGEPATPSCSWADMNADGTVDCADADLFAAIFTGDPTDLNFFQCNPPIPAVSQWGAAMLTLMLAAIGTLAFRGLDPPTHGAGAAGWRGPFLFARAGQGENTGKP